MSVFVPYTTLQFPVMKSLAPWRPIYIPMDQGDAYLEYWKERWAAGRWFINVEHDVVVEPDTILSLLECPEPWCFFAYDPHQHPFGCVRIGEALIEALPNVWSDLESQRALDGFNWNGWPAWSYLDSWFFEYAASKGIHPHQHYPNVRHLHPACPSPEKPSPTSGLAFILHPWVNGLRVEDQTACWEGLSEIRQHWPVLDAPVGDDDRWPQLFKNYWSRPGTMLIVEHDMGVKTQHIKELLDCPHPHCAFAYLLHEPSIGKPIQAITHRVLTNQSRPPRHPYTYRWIRENEEWADAVGFGLVKISEETRRRVACPRQLAWASLDATVSIRVSTNTRQPWHIHWPAVPHHHENSYGTIIISGPGADDRAPQHHSS